LPWIIKIFLLGALIVIPIAIGERIAGIFVSEFVVFVIIAPIIEECGKYFIVTRYVYQTDEFDEPVDGITPQQRIAEPQSWKRTGAARITR
jgi:RsiW-degrading membrane proteinase PrsW (M82 family)